LAAPTQATTANKETAEIFSMVISSCVSSRFRQDGDKYRELNIGAKARNGSGDLMR
jgi:hypothetical protein